MTEGLMGLRKGDTFDSVTTRHRGLGPGFDVLRFALASLIFLGHVKMLSGLAGPLHAELTNVSMAGWTGRSRPFQLSLMPAFFALSGFLVTGSAFRLRQTSTFLAFRTLRIFPALITEVLLSAFLLGAVFTTLPLHDYFTHPQFYRYFANAVGHVTLFLPGVFGGNPVPWQVNGNLWTLPAEFYCYLLIALAMITRLAYDRRVYSALFATAWVALALLNGLGNLGIRDGPYTIPVIIFYFFTGVLFFHWKDKIPVNVPTFLICGTLGYFILLHDHMSFFGVPFITYCALFVGMLEMPKSRFLASGDYSYGIYLYGYPITQAVIATFPSLRMNLWGSIPVCTGLTLLFSVMSWHLIEKHSLKLKRFLPKTLFPRSSRAAPIHDQVPQMGKAT